MGQIWLLELPNVLRAAGLSVSTYPGWEFRSRRAGGYDRLMGVGTHHTAGSGLYPDSDMAYMWQNSSIKPVGAIYLARDGHVTVGAAGSTNTQGAGGPYRVSKGVIGEWDGNAELISIEGANRGNGQEWPTAQQNAYVRMCAALCVHYGFAASDCVAHFQWSPGRKVDPAGESRFASGANMWDQAKFYAEVQEQMDDIEGDDDMALTDEDIERIAERVWEKSLPQIGLNSYGDQLPDRPARWFVASSVRAGRFYLGPTQADEPVPEETRTRLIKKDTTAILKNQR